MWKVSESGDDYNCANRAHKATYALAINFVFTKNVGKL